jgi:hypothetical protein
MVTPLDDSALDTIFRKARTQNKSISRLRVSNSLPCTI